MAPRSSLVMLSRGSFISLGLACTIGAGLANFAVTSWRVASLEKAQEEQERRISALEASMSVHTTGLAVLTTELEGIKETLARIDGRMSGMTTPAKGRQ